MKSAAGINAEPAAIKRAAAESRARYTPPDSFFKPIFLLSVCTVDTSEKGT